MAITPGDLATQWSTLYETLFRQSFNNAIAVERARLAPLVMEIPLGDHQGNTVQLDWLGAAPQMRAWTDEKLGLGLSKYSWTATPTRWEASIDVDLDAFRDARFNVYEPRIQEMSQNASRLRYNLISDLIRLGNATACYDSQYFFDTDHSEGDSGTQSNKLTGSGTSLAQITTDYYAAMAALCGFKDDRGIPLAPSTFRPMVWIPNNATMIERWSMLQGADLAGGGDSNVLKSKFDLVVDPRLTDTNNWFMFRTDRVMKPFIVVNREEANYRDNFGATTGDPFERRKGRASVEARMTATYGLWQCGVETTN